MVKINYNVKQIKKNLNKQITIKLIISHKFFNIKRENEKEGKKLRKKEGKRNKLLWVYDKLKTPH